MKITYSLIISLLLSLSSFSQILEINKTGEPESSLDLENLVKNILLSGDCVQVDAFSSQQFGNPNDNTTKSYGFFKKDASSNFPFKQGIILTSGNAFAAGNNVINSTIDNTNNLAGDADLENALGISNTKDATFVKFNFIPLANKISFRFLMASEEYDGKSECLFADGFAFLLREVGTTNYINLAVLPDGTAVNVTNINDANNCRANSEFFEGYNIGDTNYGGRTVVLTAAADVTPNTTYEIKLVVADQGDPLFDSAVFLEANSFNLGINLGDDQLTSTKNAVCGATKLLDAGVDGNYKWFKDGIEISGANSKTYLANLGDGTYKVEVSLSSGSCATSTDEIELNFVAPPIVNKPKNLTYCDSDGDGINTFDLKSEKDLEILNGQSNALFEVLYFDSLSAANANVTGTNLPNPYTNTIPFTQTIYARVHNIGAPNTCFAITDFQLEVTTNPKPTQPTNYHLCDDLFSGSDTDGKANFVLNTKDAEILGSLNPTQYNVSYHTTLTDATTSSTTNAIDKNNYLVTNSQKIFVRVENIDNPDCNAISNDAAGSTFTSFEVIVDPLPVILANPVVLKQCDTDPDLISTFNLTEAEISISNNRDNETFQYFATQADAIAGNPQVPDKIRYPVNAFGEAWVKTISNQGCFRISKIELIVSYAGDVNYNREFVTCDDLLDVDGNNTAANSDTDGISFFDFSEATQEIINLFTPLIQPDLEVFYYQTIADRTASINEIPDISNHRNNSNPAYANNQTIYLKIKNKINNNCTGIGQLTLKVKPVPIANTPSNFNLCDDALSGSTTDGINSGINLTDKVPEILGPTQSVADYMVSFHTSEIGANTNTDIITNDTNYTNSIPPGFVLGDINEQTIFVRVQDRNTTPQCSNNSTSFKIIINPLPQVATTITPLAVCDIPTAIDSDPRNRVAQNINLTSKDSEILAGKTNHRVAYFTTEQNAIAGTPEITNPSDFQNIPNLTTFPSNFNTDEPGIQTIFFTVVDLGGNGCSSVFSTYQLLVYPEPNIPINISDYSECDNKTDADADDANGINGDISLINKIPEILANYPPSEFADFNVTFYTSLADAQAGDISLALDANKYENTTNNQTIFVRVENTKNTPVACVHTRLSFNINIQPIPSFTVVGEENIDPPQIVCLNNTPLVLEAENAVALYDYVWTNQAGTQLGFSSTLNVTNAGKYTVTASDRFPNGCSRSRTIVVNESNPATLLESYITIIDESTNIGSQNTISVSIDVISNNLGPGDYQFAIRNDDNGNRIPFIGFQDEPLFENLDGGIYTIIVNDKNGCVPDATMQISVLQFPKFFTPNGDGIYDTWAVRGANKTFYPNASINIFDRFGRIVAKLPIDSQGWDGTYGGKKLPSDDYWFDVQLIPANTSKNPILKKGHFSLLRK